MGSLPTLGHLQFPEASALLQQLLQCSPTQLLAGVMPIVLFPSSLHLLQGFPPLAPLSLKP